MRIFVLIGGLLVVVLMAALIGPYFVDWSDYKERFEAEASRILGQDVVVNGSASARLLPFPSVTFTDVRVGPPDQPNMTVEEFSMDAELSPFLSGEVLIFDMRLVSPVLRLDLNEEGRPTWQWPTETLVNPAQVTLEQAQFTDGTIILRDRKNQRQWDFVSLDGTAAAQSLFGPWRVDGAGLVRGVPFEARVSTGSLDRAGFSTRINAVLPDQKIEVTTEGRVAPPTGDVKAWYAGTFTLEPTGSEAQPYILAGLFQADARSVIVDEFRGDFGNQDDPYSVTGSASIEGGLQPRFAFKATGNQVSLGDEDVADPISFGERLSSVESVLSALPFPPMEGSVELDLPTIVAGNTTIRDLRLSAKPEPGGDGRLWRIEELNAKLPGRTVLEASGDLTLASDDQTDVKNSFVGELVLASRQPSGLAAWLTDDFDDSIRTLPNAGLAAQVKLDADRQILEDVELIIGDTRLDGRFVRRSDEQSLPYILLSLSGENARYETLQSLSGVLLGTDGDVRLTEHDIDVDLNLTNASLAGIDVGGINTAFRVRGERIEVDRLSISGLYNAAISGTATLVTTENGPNRISWDTSLITPDGDKFVRGLATRFPSIEALDVLDASAKRSPSDFADVALDVVGSAIIAADDEIEASSSFSGELGGTSVSLTGTVLGQFEKTNDLVGSISGTLTNDETATIVSQLGFEILPVRPLGAGRAEISLNGSLNRGVDAQLALETDESRLSTDGVFSVDQDGVKFSGNASANLADAEPWMDLFGYIFPYTGLGTSLEAKASVQYGAETLLLSDLSGSIADNAFSGALNVGLRQSGPSLSGDLQVQDFAFDFLANIVSGSYDFTDREALFAAPLYSDHSVDLALKAEHAFAYDAELRDLEARLIYKDGAVSLQNAKASVVDGGTVEATMDVQSSDGSLLLNGQFNAKQIDLDTLLSVADLPVDAAGDIALSLTGTGKSLYALLGSLTGSGVIAVDEASLTGLNTEAIGPIIDQADQIGYEITDQQIEEIAVATVYDGTIEFPAREVPISIRAGLADASNISAQLGSSSLNVNLEFDFAEQTIMGDARLGFDASIDAIAGTQPEARFVFEQLEAETPALVSRDFTGLISFVRQRALEREQARVEALQARLLEKQRFRRQVLYIKDVERQARLREEERLRQIEEERLRRAEEAARLAEELRVQEEARRRAEAEAKAEAEEAARLEAIRQQELEAERAEQRRLEELEAARLEEERRLRAEEEARLAEEAAKREAERVEAERLLIERLEAERLALENSGLEQQSAPISQPPGTGNAVDDSLLRDPLAPIPNAGSIFQDLNFRN